MKHIIVVLAIFLCIGKIDAQTKLSPDKNRIAYIDITDSICDIFVYDISTDKLTQITKTAAQWLTDKIDLNWIDNENILFLSDHDGTFQQYVVNVSDKTLKANGRSSKGELDLFYSPKNKESYYTSLIKGNEKAIYRRKLSSTQNIKITKNKAFYTLHGLSPNEEYLIYSEDYGQPFLFSLKNNSIIKPAFPEEDIQILTWSPSCDKFLYSYTIGKSETTFTDYLVEYDIATKKSKRIHSLETLISWTNHSASRDSYKSGIWSPCENKYLFSSTDKTFLLDTNTYEIKEYEIAGTPIDWIDSCKSILCSNGNKRFIFDIETRQITEMNSFSYNVINNPTPIYSDTVPPMFPGGETALMNHLFSHMIYPPKVIQLGIQGRVVLKFIVTPSGRIHDIEVISSPHLLLSQEAKRVVNFMPNWIPGKMGGKPIYTYFTLPLIFKLHK